MNWERFDIQQFQLRLFEYRSRHRMYNYGLAKCILKRWEEVWIIFFNTLMAQWTNSRTLSDKNTDKRWCNIISNHAMTQSMQYRMFIKLNEWNRTYSMRTKTISTLVAQNRYRAAYILPKPMENHFNGLLQQQKYEFDLFSMVVIFFVWFVFCS